MDQRATRYRDDDIVLNGITGENIVVPSANPRNYYQAITDPEDAPKVDIDAKLFVPASDGPLPAVMIVPGSLGLGANHDAHAATLLGLGFAVCVVDPFAPRTVESTIGDQTAYSFAASAFDVLATLRVLLARPEIDNDRIAALGHSRGGAAVTIASCRHFAEPIVGESAGLAAAYAAYPWCGHQFEQPTIGSTRYRAIIGELDEWCSIQEAQAQVHAMQLTGADASARVVGGVHHSFDRADGLHTLEDAAVAPTAPTVMLSADGAMIDPRIGLPNSDSVDLDGFMASIVGGHGRSGAAIGGDPASVKLFVDDMVAFFSPLLER